jgi:hypothetical protein
MTAGEVRNVLDSHRRRRPMRVMAYSLLAVGNNIILFDPTRSFEDIPFQLRYIWNGIMLLGCAMGVTGGITDKYLIEMIGLPLVLSGMAAFVVVLTVGWTSGSLAFACFLACLWVVLFSRGLDLWELATRSAAAERRRK